MSYTADTDGNGRFLIADVQPGEYSISAERQGFVIESEAEFAPPPTFKVEAGQSLKDVKIKLVPLAAIIGRVLDDDGDPCRGARVEALAYSFQEGKKQLQSVDQAIANENGEFRIFGLTPRNILFARCCPKRQPDVFFNGGDGWDNRNGER